MFYFVLCRKRDKHGNLVRRNTSLPPGVEVDEDGMRVVKKPVPYAVMFQQVKQHRHGLDKTEAMSQWKDFLKKNPKCGRMDGD